MRNTLFLNWIARSDPNVTTKNNVRLSCRLRLCSTRLHSHLSPSLCRCRECAHKSQCTTGHYRQIAIHVHEAARQRARERATVPAFAAAQRQRRKVEALFAELKNQIGLRRVRLRRIKHVREQFFLAATAQNLKRPARFLRSRSLESVTAPI
jgi:Transposase DDE domain